MPNNEYKLLISDLRLAVYLGCNINEKATKQTVSVDIVIQFLELPLGAKTDQLQDTVCYARMVEYIHRFLEIDIDNQNDTTWINGKNHREFNLIEHLCVEIHKAIVTFLAANQFSDSLVTVMLNKQNPPVIGVNGNISFMISSS